MKRTHFSKLSISTFSTHMCVLWTNKLHEPVGRVQFVVLEKINKCLFIPNCTREIMRLRFNNIHEKYEMAYHN